MKNKMKKVVSLVGVSILAMSMLAGCVNKEEAASTEEAVSTEEVSVGEVEELTGTVRLAGSTSMEKVANFMKEDFMEKNPGVIVTVEFSGSSSGVQSLLDGQCDIGNASRGLKQEELDGGAVQNNVAFDGITAIVNPENTVAGITTEELVKIYTGEIKNWSELGGADGQIVVIGREAGSGTRGAFEELLDVEDACVMAQELDSNGVVCATVESIAEAIGYASLDIAEAEKEKLGMLSLDGVVASVATIKDGTYSLFRLFVMATNGTIEEQTGVVKEFLAYAFGEEGQTMVKEAGAIPVN
jgi:phosphate transport system substrate-binding protein